MIFLSTANVFDNSTDTAHVESDPTDSGSEYGKYKIACEKMLSEILGESLAILRLPFVWGKNSPRVLQVREGCQKGCLEVYEGLKSNHASDMQIAEYVEWIIEREKSGIFHVGTSELMDYPQFIRKMVEPSGWKQPEFQREYTPEVLAVLTEREDIPERLSWTTERLLAYLSDSRLDDEGGEQSVVTKNAELCKTVIGTVKISRYLPYPCDPGTGNCRRKRSDSPDRDSIPQVPAAQCADCFQRGAGNCRGFCSGNHSNCLSELHVSGADPYLSRGIGVHGQGNCVPGKRTAVDNL